MLSTVKDTINVLRRKWLEEQEVAATLHGQPEQEGGSYGNIQEEKLLGIGILECKDP